LSEEWLRFVWEAMKPLFAEEFGRRGILYYKENVEPELDKAFEKAIEEIRKGG